MKEGKKAKSNIIKSIFVVMIFAVLFSTPVQAAKLNKKSLTLVKGKTYTLKLKGTKKKAKWQTKNKKVAKISNKKKSSVKIKAVKAGKTTIIAKVGKKTYKCKVTVVNSKKEKDSDSTTDADKTDKSDGQSSDTPSDKQPEQTTAKKKVWVITKQAETCYVQRGVNPYSVYECWCGVIFKSKDYDSIDDYIDAYYEHMFEHGLKDENTGHHVYTQYEDYEWNEIEYPEEGYWIEIGADENPEGIFWRADKSYPGGGYYCIDKSGK